MALLQDVKTYLSIADTNSDALLQALITSVSTMVQTFCDDNFLQQTYNWTISGWGSDILPLPYGPVSAVNSLIIDGAPVPLLPTAGGYGYVIDPDGQCIRLSGARFTRGVGNVVANYTAGYANQAALPMDLQFCVWKLVGLKLREIGHLDKTSENAKGVTTVSYLRAWAPDDVILLLAHYQRRAAG
jgi:uncharacterized phiE125 gp8 family phage protein